MTTTVQITTELGVISLTLLPDAAPQTVAHIVKLVSSGFYNGTSFYRSDFVIQFGLHGTGRPAPDLTVNETNHGARRISNTRGTAAIAHFDVPDCGGSEIFINLQANPHLDTAYGGYCVFARVEDPASLDIVDAIAAAVKTTTRGTVGIQKAVLV
jgi:cyclophilin family peptidyl-prolyl cis-trans isomerase